MFSSLHTAYIQHLVSEYSLSESIIAPLISPELLSPFQVTLPMNVLVQAQNFVRASFELRQSSDYQKFLEPDLNQHGLKDPGNKSILMSYDFHVTDDMKIKLIEVNTNASFLALGYEMYQLRKLPLPVSDFRIEEILANIKTELSLQGKKLDGSTKIAIIDEQPHQQRLFVEFLLYQAYFKKWGHQCEIADYRDIPVGTQFIYNRFTDFFLSQSESASLRQAFLNRTQCFSPNPYEYLMLADKQRMIDWGKSPWKEKIPGENLPQSVSLSPENAEQVWSERKKYFLKPKRAFGAKQSYKGASISRRLFDEITSQDFIAQEYFPAQELPFETPEGPQKFKYDLRFYAYQDRVQMAVARLYQGQVTNLKTPYGGFAPVIFKS